MITDVKIDKLKLISALLFAVGAILGIACTIMDVLKIDNLTFDILHLSSSVAWVIGATFGLIVAIDTYKKDKQSQN